MLSLLVNLASARQHQILVVTNGRDAKDRYSTFFNDLQSLGTTITYASSKASNIELMKFGERVYDTVVLLSSTFASFNKDADELKEFLDNGGNAIVFTSTDANSIQEKLFRHLNLRVITMQKMGDILGNNEIILRRIVAPESVVSKPVAPLVYDGGFAIIDRPNEFRFPIVTGSLEHLIANDKISTAATGIATDLIPIYALQSRVGGRIVFIHSPDFASNEFYEKKVQLAEDLTQLDKPFENGNRELMIQLAQWATHYKSHIKITKADHVSIESGITPVQYHIRENVKVFVDVEQAIDGKFVPYDGEDLQVEIFMLGTFIRRHMKKTDIKGRYEQTIMLPDRAGNFKIKVFTSLPGFMNAREEMAIAIRPLAIREKEKFLDCAKPYQVSMMCVMAAAFLASVHFLYHKPTVAPEAN